MQAGDLPTYLALKNSLIKPVAEEYIRRDDESEAERLEQMQGVGEVTYHNVEDLGGYALDFGNLGIPRFGND